MGSTVLRGGPRGLGGYRVCPAGPYPGIYLEILGVFGAAELRQAGGPHQGEEVKEEQPVTPQDGVGSLTVTPESAGPEGRGRWGSGSSQPFPRCSCPGKGPQTLLLQDPTLSPARDPEHPHLSNFSLLFVFPCWITCTKSYVRMNGTRSRLIPNLVLKFPRKWPKSMWNS